MKKLLIILGVIVLGGGYYLLTTQSQTPTPPDTTSSESSAQGSELAEVEKYTLEEVARHGSKDDCWLAIDGKIYDVTEYIKGGFHPGKEAILMGCGKDASEMFSNRPNGSGSHSDKARNMLQRFYKGEVAAE